MMLKICSRGFEFHKLKFYLTLLQLLTRDPEKRLGSGSDGAAAIRKHPFFVDLDWTKLEARQVDPPFRPKVRDITDISQIDTMFTQVSTTTPTTILTLVM